MTVRSVRGPDDGHEGPEGQNNGHEGPEGQENGHDEGSDGPKDQMGRTITMHMKDQLGRMDTTEGSDPHEGQDHKRT